MELPKADRQEASPGHAKGEIEAGCQPPPIVVTVCALCLISKLCMLLFSHLVTSDSFVTPWTGAPPWDFPGRNSGVGCLL